MTALMEDSDGQPDTNHDFIRIMIESRALI